MAKPFTASRSCVSLRTCTSRPQVPLRSRQQLSCLIGTTSNSSSGVLSRRELLGLTTAVTLPLLLPDQAQAGCVPGQRFTAQLYKYHAHWRALAAAGWVLKLASAGDAVAGSRRN